MTELIKQMDDVVVTVNPIDGLDETENEVLLKLQLKMATTSINHEYARVEYDDTNDREKREELENFMMLCHQEYLEAREQLAAYNPIVLASFEHDLLIQKQTALAQYNA
ncbi:hypothetical protein KKA47_02720 [bacterium]|nr:hypothetical protein [bacterium]